VTQGLPLLEHYTTFAITIGSKENCRKRRFFQQEFSFVLQLLRFKTYPHADAKQGKTKWVTQNKTTEKSQIRDNLIVGGPST
jgi:hypothetical protein